MEKKIDIFIQYSGELMQIQNKLNQLEKGRIYELTNAKMDGSLATNIEELKYMINDLLYKVEYEELSLHEKLKEAHKKFHVE